MKQGSRLLDLTEELFQYVCRLNRSARKGAAVEPAVVRADIKQLFGRMRAEAQGDAGLQGQLEKVELPLIYFVDFMIKESDLPFAQSWQELAHEQNKLAGDEEFFDLLDETLKDQSEAATERLAVFYTCLGLGFTGFYTGQPEYLTRKMQEISARIRHLSDTDPQSRIVPEAYEHTDTSDLIEPPGRSLGGLLVALGAMAVALLAGNFYLYYTSSADLLRALTDIQQRGEAAAES